MHKKIIQEIRNILDGENKDDKIMYDKIFKIVNDTVGLEVLGAPDPKKVPEGSEYMDKEKSNIGGHSKLEVKNASDYPKTYYFRHMEKGIVHYPKQKMMVLINDETLLKMQNSLNNKPIYIEHKDKKEDKVENLEKNMHGVVSDAFYNKLDGWHWSKTVVFTDEANDLIEKGWLISNSYSATEVSQEGGLYHNIPYSVEVKNGIYDHIALVEKPRYEGVMILTPEEYKKYNQELELKLQNSLQKNDKKRSPSMFNLFKKSKVENAEEMAEAFVEVEGSSPVKLSELISSYQNAKEDKKEDEKKNMYNAEEVEIDGKKVSIKELISTYKAEQKEIEEKKKLDNEEEENKKKLEAKEKEEKEKDMKNALEENKHFDNMKNAIEKGQRKEDASEKKYETMKDKIERGKKY